MPVLKQRLLKIAVFAFAVMIVAASPASFANGWVAVGERGTILNSQDGINWVEVDSPTEETLRGLAFDGQGSWVGSGQAGTVILSADAQNWSVQSSGNTDALWGTGYADGQWIVTGGQGRIITSPDGAEWTSVNGRFSFTLFDVAYDRSALFAISGDSGLAARILTSPDAVAWTQEPPTPLNPEGLYGITYGDSQWVAVGDKGTILTSADPVSRVWDSQSGQTAVDLRGIVYNGSDLYVAVGREGTILSSIDGVTWAPRSSGTTYDLWGVAYDGSGQYVAVGDEGVILSSADGLSWVVESSPTFRLLYDVAPGTLAQVIDFPAQNPLFQDFVSGGNYPLSPEATATSGLPVTYMSLTPDVCTISDTSITMVKVGVCQIEASQAGNSAYLPAEPVTQSILQLAVIGPGVPLNPGLSFDPQDQELLVQGGTFSLSPPATTTRTPEDPQPLILYASSTPAVCTIPVQGTIEVTMLEEGDCIIGAVSLPNSKYSVGGPVGATIQIIRSTPPTPPPTPPTAVPVAMWQFYGSLAALMSALVFYRSWSDSQ
ncbi:WD40/YVTN/BNR-like repeat-containing protein [Candidatus Marimicrobium litorale]|uniref:DUF6242 domain-containing protein n=1 Tax=Candidatus Marimicrobium litorale TaxID=2518991 RepID=A0ABT3TA49_9GAMM|nr:hypothetical protein [Candidatus Marimicrobium litorale]MCX2978710.1 hypothetical protein [Candidatus Marimicrobium litorale]